MPAAKLALDIWAKTGEVGQFPRRAPTHILVKGQQVDIDAETQALYQMYIGNRVDMLYTGLAANPNFMRLPDDRKAKRLSNALTDINTDAKRLILGVR